MNLVDRVLDRLMEVIHSEYREIADAIKKSPTVLIQPVCWVMFIVLMLGEPFPFRLGVCIILGLCGVWFYAWDFNIPNQDSPSGDESKDETSV